MERKCPVCHKTVKVSIKEHSEESKFFPFCSQRCKLIDLGAWLDADYKIVSGSEPEESIDSSDISPTSSDNQ